MQYTLIDIWFVCFFIFVLFLSFIFDVQHTDLEDNHTIQDEIDNILKNPVFISALNVANYETVGGDLTLDKTNDFNVHHDNDDDNDDVDDDDGNNSTDLDAQNTASDSNCNTIPRFVEKLRIVIPPPSMASPSSMHSSSSDGYSPVRSKKNKKRFCIKCNIRFKHTAEWMKHLEKHISLPSVKLMELTADDVYYKSYLQRTSKRCRTPSTSSDCDNSLKIKLKIPRTDATNAVPSTIDRNDSCQETLLTSRTTATTTTTTNAATQAAAALPRTECGIRVLRAEEIKQSPPSSPLKVTLPENAMVAVPSENRIHYECPTLDGLHQYAEDAMNEESTAQILKQLLETPHDPPEPNEWDSTPNEFISIDRLAHTCKTCNEKYPDLNFLQEHQRLTGHGEKRFSAVNMLEPIQEMTIDQSKHYHPPPTSQLEHMQKPKITPPPPQLAMYGQPPVLPIHQMESQVRNFANMNQMPNRDRYAMPRQPPPMQPRPLPPGMPPRHPSQMPPNYSMHRFLPPAQMMRPNTMQPNQPVNMTPFLEMNPDMYNPQQQNMIMNGNGVNYNRPPNQMTAPPNQMMNRFMRPTPQPPAPSDQMMQQQRFAMQQSAPRPPMNGPLISRPTRNLPAYPLRPSMNHRVPPQMMPNQRPMMPLSPMEQHQKTRFEQMVRAREIENRPFISNAPRTEGLPVIESVQSGAITLNSTKKPIDTGATIQISDQITLSVKNKDALLAKPSEKSPTPVTDTNKMASILVNRGITVKSASKLLEKVKLADEQSNKQTTPYATAEQAVQKLQLNNSVSIISKKKVIQSAAVAKDNETIDLSNDDDTPEASATFKKPSTDVLPPKQRPTVLKCPIKKCDMKFATVKALRDHSIKVHQLTRLNRFKCNTCSARFASSEAVRIHVQKMHGKAQPDFGIPIVNFNDPLVRKKMLSFGFTNFLPLTNVRDDKSELFGMPIININGPSVNNLKNLLDTDSTKIMPITTMRTIPWPKIPPPPPPPPSLQSSPAPSTPATATVQSAQTSRTVPKLSLPTNPSATHSTETPPTLHK